MMESGERERERERRREGGKKYWYVDQTKQNSMAVILI